MKVAAIIEKLCKNKFEVYVTGGSVRDSLAGLPAKDEDIVTNATPAELKELFQGHEVTTVVAVKKKREGEVGQPFPVTFIDGIDVATYRTDYYKGLDNKDCEVVLVKSIVEDLSRRDFTVNSLAQCPHTGDIIDLFNGIGDLDKRIIRFVGNPKDRIYEDPDRIIRACRFLAKLNGQFDCDTYEALCKYSHYVRDHVAKERIRLEIMKALELPNPSLFFQALHEIDALQYIFPPMIPCMEHHHGKHHREDIFVHLMVVGDSISPKFPLLRLAGYLHDVGKPMSYSEDGKFVGHERVGAEVVTQELRALKFSTEEVSKVSNLIACHMYSIQEPTKKAVRKLLSNLTAHDVSYQEFLRLRIADRVGNLGKSNFPLSEVKNFLSKVDDVINEKTPFTVKSLAIDGHDVMRILGIPSSKKVGEVLNLVFDYVLEYGPEVNDREILINWMKDTL